MGYDLHIVRTKSWVDAETNPITKQNVDSLIANDPELEWSTTDYLDMKEDDGTVTRYFLINWNGAPRFWWYKNEITCKNPDETTQLKLVQLAKKLEAFCIGDENERYELKKGFFGKEKLVIIPEE